MRLLPAFCLLSAFAIGIDVRSVLAADYPDSAYRPLNAAVVAGHVVPRYQRFARESAVLGTAVQAFHATPTEGSLTNVKAAFDEAMDGYEASQHIRFGPVETFMRNMRFAFWPDPRNTAARQIEEILKSRNPAAISADTFGHGSIAVQGLSAFEILIFSEGATAALVKSDESGAFRRDMILAVATNIAEMAEAVRRDWVEGASPYSILLSQPPRPGSRYQTPQEVTLDLFKSLHATVELVADHKAAKPLGSSVTAARPRLAESWRSQRSLANIRLNLEAGEALYFGEGGKPGFSAFVRNTAGDTALDDLLRRAFGQTRRTADSITLPLERAIADRAERPKVEKLATEAKALKILLAQRLTVALGIPLGFNALDGD